jgi:hypothetical protein
MTYLSRKMEREVLGRMKKGLSLFSSGLYGSSFSTGRKPTAQGIMNY